MVDQRVNETLQEISVLLAKLKIAANPSERPQLLTALRNAMDEVDTARSLSA
jgi:hypothetical protein